MADSPYQSLYRRYRPQRFSEVRGQEHVTRALRNAVRDGRIGHAYLFSGPRGTGKTSTARILAKVLNCAAPQDGEPDCVCENCLTVQRGQVTDWLLEQDAASKSKVDDMRDLLDRVPLGTSGNRKVIILDEVHMLSQGAENALLKTLEEPPEHVVFVLATTDPQKVRPTIRSRTQHFEFHLLPPDVMEEHIRQVIEDAGLAVGDEDTAVAHVVRLGGGSARDTLSALDQVAALGEVMADTQPVDAILDALVASDAGAALVAVADAMATGRDPRGLGEAIIGRLRDAFLAVLGAADAHLPVNERTRAQELGEKLGASGLTRALEVLGEALTELSRKPDPRIVLEVALVRLTRPEADRSLDGLVARIERLEDAVRSGGGLPASGSSSGSDSPSTAGAGDAQPPARRPGAGSAATGGRSSGPPRGGSEGGGGGPASAARAVLASNRPTTGKGKGSGSPPPPPPPTASVEAQVATPPAGGEPSAAAAPSPAEGVSTGAASTAAAASPAEGVSGGAASRTSRAGGTTAVAARPAVEAGPANLGALVDAWRAKILTELPPSVRSRWRGGTWIEPSDDGVARFAVDNEWHQRACEEGRGDVERVLGSHFGAPVRIEVVVEGRVEGRSAGRSTSGPTPADDPGDAEDLGATDIGDLTELADANDVATGGVDLLLREFGGELVEEDPR